MLIQSLKWRRIHTDPDPVSDSVLQIRNVYPGSWFLSIPNPWVRIPEPINSDKGGGKICCLNFFRSHILLHKIENYLILFQVGGSYRPIWVGDRGSGETYPVPGVKKAPDTGSGSATLIPDLQPCRSNLAGPTGMLAMRFSLCPSPCSS